MIIVFSLGIGIVLGFILSFLFKIVEDNQENAINNKNTSIFLNMHNSIKAIIQNKSLNDNEKFINIMQTLECNYLALTAHTNEIYLNFINKLKLHKFEKENVDQKDQFIKTLEKEIRKYLREQFNHVYEDDVAKVKGFAEPREKRIEELEKDKAYVEEQLTKVTELLKEVQGYIENIDDELYDKIEQFLKE